MEQFQPGVDYIYCEECQVHVPCIPLEPGVWEVQCPRCVGECALCHCHLSTHCFGRGGVPIELRVRLVHTEGGKL
jgi:hypothetical protein